MCSSDLVEIIHVDRHVVYNDSSVWDVLKVFGVKLSQYTQEFGANIMESFNNAFKGAMVVFHLENSDLTVVFKRFTPKSRLKNGAKFKSIKALASEKDVRDFVFKQKSFLANFDSIVARTVQGLNAKPWQDTGVSRDLSTACLYFLEQAGKVDFMVSRPGINIHLERGQLKTQVATVASNLNMNKFLDRPFHEVVDLDLEDLVRLVENTPQGQTRLFLSLKQDIAQGFSTLQSENASLQKEIEDLKQEVRITTKEKERLARLENVEKDYKALLETQRKAREASEKRKSRKKQITRDVVTLSEFEGFMKQNVGFSTDILIRSRQRLSLALLYVTGARIDELRQLRLSNVSQMFIRKNPYMRFYSSKSGSWRKAYLDKRGNKALKSVAKDWEILKEMLCAGFKTKKEGLEKACLSGKPKNPELPCSRVHFNKTINDVLKAYFTEDKYVRSHSFRSSYITDNWRSTRDIELVRQMVGHKTRSSTLSYVGENETLMRESMESHGLI